VSSVEALTRALAVAACHEVRVLSFQDLMSEQAATERRLTEKFGAGAVKDFDRFLSSYPALANRAEWVNLMSNPDFAETAVRILRASH
jgi:hypothetical protein